MDNKIVLQFAGKLGLSGETTIIEKTKELLRLLELKGSSLTQIGDYARCVICLDLSTSLFGHEFDSQTALKLSGFKKPSYLNNRRIIEKLLDLSKPMGVSEICIQLSLTEIQTASKTILEQFVSSITDLHNTTHPQYAAMAVYQMCKLKKIKVQKTKFSSFGHLKPGQWTLLEKSWDAWAKNNQENLKEFQVAKNSRHNTASDTAQTDKESQEAESTASISAAPPEEYAEWRERVLKQAFEDLERLRSKQK